MTKDATKCSGCGGEKDAEGWCANYCEDDGAGGGITIDPEADCQMCGDQGLKTCSECGGSGKDHDDSCAACSGVGKVYCAHNSADIAYNG